MRRFTRAGLTKLVTAWVLLVSVSCTSGGSRDGSTSVGQPVPLSNRLSMGPESFAFSYRARGTDVLDCVLPNRDFEGTAFADGALSITAETPSGVAEALSFRDAVFLDDALFARGSVTAEWIRLERSSLEAGEPALNRILGVDLAAYVVAAGPPPSGNEVVAAALEQSAIDSQLDPIRLPGGAAAAGYRLVVEGEDTVPVIDAWVDGAGFVVRVQVQDSLPDQPGKPNPDTGWIVTYRPLPTDATAPPPPEGFVEATAERLAELAPPRRDGCELEIGPEPTTPRPQP